MGYVYLMVICLITYLTSAYVPQGYLGCFEDKTKTILGIKLQNSDSISAGECKLRCSTRGYRFAGTENANECYCDFTVESYPMSSGCNIPCSGYKNEYCGGHMRISVYDTWYCARKPCKNNATCEDLTSAVYKCHCVDNWEGRHCEKEITTQSAISTLSAISSRSTTNFAKSTADRDQNTNQGSDNSSLLVLAYVLAPIGCLVVFVSVLLLIWKKREQNEGKEVRRINDDQTNDNSEADGTLVTSTSFKTSSFKRNGYGNGIYSENNPEPNPLKQSHLVKSNIIINDGRPDVNIYDTPEDTMYITPIYTYENEYTTIQPQTEADRHYEMLRKNNLCENVYKTLSVHKVNPFKTNQGPLQSAL